MAGYIVHIKYAHPNRILVDITEEDICRFATTECKHTNNAYLLNDKFISRENNEIFIGWCQNPNGQGELYNTVVPAENFGNKNVILYPIFKITDDLKPKVEDVEIICKSNILIIAGIINSPKYTLKSLKVEVFNRGDTIPAEVTEQKFEVAEDMFSFDLKESFNLQNFDGVVKITATNSKGASESIFDSSPEQVNVGHIKKNGIVALKHIAINKEIYLSKSAYQKIIKNWSDGLNISPIIDDRYGLLQLIFELGNAFRDISNDIVLWDSETEEGDELGYSPSENAVLNLLQPISKQKTGIVLVWSRYNRNGDGIRDYGWTYSFIPKWHAENADGLGVNIPLTGFENNPGSIYKYLYIFNDKIKGHKFNWTNTMSDKFTLRTVIGV